MIRQFYHLGVHSIFIPLIVLCDISLPCSIYIVTFQPIWQANTSTLKVCKEDTQCDFLCVGMSPVCEDYQAGTLVFCFHLHQILKYLEISWCKVTPLTRKNLKGPQPYNPVLIIFIKWVLIHTHLLNEYLLNLFQMIIKWVFICQEAASWHVWHGPTSVLWPGAWTWYYSIVNNYWLPKTLQWIKDNIYADTEF